jgi:hypothetical protein
MFVIALPHEFENPEGECEADAASVELSIYAMQAGDLV